MKDSFILSLLNTFTLNTSGLTSVIKTSVDSQSVGVISNRSGEFPCCLQHSSYHTTLHAHLKKKKNGSEIDRLVSCPFTEPLHGKPVWRKLNKSATPVIASNCSFFTTATAQYQKYGISFKWQTYLDCADSIQCRFPLPCITRSLGTSPEGSPRCWGRYSAAFTVLLCGFIHSCRTYLTHQNHPLTRTSFLIKYYCTSRTY